MPRPVAVFCMPDRSHVNRLRPLIAGLASRGVPVHVFTGRDFRSHVERAGGIFEDLFASGSIEDADGDSMPMPCRLVSFAGRYAGEIRDRVAALAPALVVHDTFAVVGWVVADLLRIPRVNVCAGHNVVPSRFIAGLATDPRVRVSPRCVEAVERLQTIYGVPDASPFSYVAGVSRDLNVSCEPPEFLDEAGRRAFEPLAFYGSLPDECAGGHVRQPPGVRPDGPLKVYICFGTIVWRYYTAEAVRALSTLSDHFARDPNVHVRISLGGAAIDPEARARLTRSNVACDDFVDQWRTLADSDCFITQHGLNSTHEAIFQRVPMLSYPFFWDQPALAGRCQSLGVAIALTDAPRGALSSAHVETAWRRFVDERGRMQAALDTARDWELAVIAGRPAVLDRIQGLCR